MTRTLAAEEFWFGDEGRGDMRGNPEKEDGIAQPT
jgi:hypothetical protein